MLKQRFGSLALPAGIALGVLAAAHAFAAVPFDSARVSYLENKVSIGDLRGASRRGAAVKDVVRSSDFVQTEVESRAELQFEDSSLVRVGQNTVFTFEAGARSMNLKKGAMLFYVPPGSGGGQIQTPSITAAVAGTVGKVAADGHRELIAILSGLLKTKWGNVPAGWAIEWLNGKVRIFKFDPSEVMTGKLYYLGGRPMPEEPEVLVTEKLRHLRNKVDLHQYDLFDINQVNPNVNNARRQTRDPAKKEEDDEEEVVRHRRHRHTPTPTPHPTATPTPTPPIYL